MTEGQGSDRTAARLVALVCAAQVLVQLGAFFWPALLPGMMTLWKLSNSEAGWITAIFYAAYMVSVPVLVTLTDRVDARRVYLFGVGCTVIGHLIFGLWAEGFWSALGARALTGMGWAGTYMTGLKLLADKVDAKLLVAGDDGACRQHRHFRRGIVRLRGSPGQSRRLAARLLDGEYDGVAGLDPGHPLRAAPRDAAETGNRWSALFDFRPVFRNRSSMAYGLPTAFTRSR